MGILGRDTPEEVGRILEHRVLGGRVLVLEGRVQAPSVAVDKGDMGLMGLGPNMVVGSLDSLEAFKVYFLLVKLLDEGTFLVQSPGFYKIFNCCLHFITKPISSFGQVCGAETSNSG